MEATAARLVAAGRPVRVETVLLPRPAGDEVVVEMAYAGISPADRRLALGTAPGDAPVPRTLGMTGVGHVGARVVAVHGYGVGSRRDGTWSTSAVLPASSLIDVPDGADLLAVAAMGFAGVAAWRAVVDLGAVDAEDRVLVLGASGTVGGMALSLARSLGASAWGQTERPAKIPGIRAQGAEQVVVAGPEQLSGAVAALRPTVVVDTLGGGFSGAALEALDPHGRLVLLGTSAGPSGLVPLRTLYRRGLRVLGYGGFLEADEELAQVFATAMAAVADGRLRPRVDCVLALTDVHAALERSASRDADGRVVLDLGSGGAA